MTGQASQVTLEGLLKQRRIEDEYSYQQRQSGYQQRQPFQESLESQPTSFRINQKFVKKDQSLRFHEMASERIMQGRT